MAALAAAHEADVDWEEEHCATALAQLEMLQNQVMKMRSAIPQVIMPFMQPMTSDTYKAYARGVMGTQSDIESLRVHWKSEETQKIFAHTTKSFATNPDLSACASIPAYGWTEREQKENKAKNSSCRGSEDNISTIITDEDISQIIVDFQKTHPNIKLDLQDENRTILTRFVCDSVTLRIRIVIEREANKSHTLNAVCLGAREPWLSVNRCIASRSQPNDLKQLLDMITAYKTVKGSSCAKCGSLLDGRALTPTARRSKQVVAANDTTDTVWQAFHESCLG